MRLVTATNGLKFWWLDKNCGYLIRVLATVIELRLILFCGWLELRWLDASCDWFSCRWLILVAVDSVLHCSTLTQLIAVTVYIIDTYIYICMYVYIYIYIYIYITINKTYNYSRYLINFHESFSKPQTMQLQEAPLQLLIIFIIFRKLFVVW